MLGLDGRAARYAWTAALVLLLLLTIYQVRSTLFIFILALLLAYLLSPLVDVLDRLLPTSRTRTPALAIAYLIFVGLLVLAGIELGSRIAEQANSLVARMPDYLGKAAQPGHLPIPAQANTLKFRIFSELQTQMRQRAPDIVGIIPKIGMKVLAYASNLIFVVVVPILSFFFLMDGRMLRQQLIELVEEGPRRALLEDIAGDVNLLLAQYMRAVLILCTNTFVWFVIFFAIIGLPFGILLAAIAFPLEFVPIIGPLTAAAIIIGVSIFSGFPHVLGVFVFLGVFRIVQDYVISPRLMSAGMKIHPLLIIFGVFAGGELAGIPGTLLSVPVLALVRILYRRIRRARLMPRAAPAVREVS